MQGGSVPWTPEKGLRHHKGSLFALPFLIEGKRNFLIKEIKVL